MFGNIDNVEHTRSMTTIVASKSVDLLYMSTQKMYALAAAYPGVKEKLQRHILLENLVSIPLYDYSFLLLKYPLQSYVSTRRYRDESVATSLAGQRMSLSMSTR